MTTREVGIVYCNGCVWTVYDSGDYAADKCKRLRKEHPQYEWSYSYNNVMITQHTVMEEDV